MNMDKRYCQNRQRKRKRTIVPSPIESKNVSPSEEERQFKLRRFVEDVGKFLSEKESCPDQKIIPETKTSLKEKRTVKKVTIPKAMMNRGLFQRSGMQTKFCTRGGYVSAVKRKLLQTYVNGMNKRQLSYLQESKKPTSSIGTSPYPSPVQTQSSHHNIESAFKLAPAKLRFQSTMQFLEETIGPSSSCSSKQMVPSSQHCQSHFQLSQPHLQHCQPTTSLLSPPVVGYQRPQRVSSYMPKASRYIHEPYLPSSPANTPFYNLKSKVFDGRGDGFHLNCFNSFLPPIEEEEDSPDFRYYPRKIF